MLVSGSVGKPKFPQEPGLDEQAQGAINRRPSHATARPVQFGDQFIGVEVLVRVEDMANQDAPLLGELFTANFKKLAKFVFGGCRHLEWSERLTILGHDALPRSSGESSAESTLARFVFYQ